MLRSKIVGKVKGFLFFLRADRVLNKIVNIFAVFYVFATDRNSIRLR